MNHEKLLILLPLFICFLFFSIDNVAQDIAGTAFEDVNGNGIDDDAAPLAGINVDLLDKFGNSTGITTVTGAAGFYELIGAIPGNNYQILFNAPGTMVSTTPNVSPPNDSKVLQPGTTIPILYYDSIRSN